jgi:hypothetical protein
MILPTPERPQPPLSLEQFTNFTDQAYTELEYLEEKGYTKARAKYCFMLPTQLPKELSRYNKTLERIWEEFCPEPKILFKNPAAAIALVDAYKPFYYLIKRRIQGKPDFYPNLFDYGVNVQFEPYNKPETGPASTFVVKMQ